jgi:pimeloyl-ACP methyl ester carboxylesterase
MNVDQIERVHTADGAAIAVKHKPNADGTPVILLHGLAVNANIWDLPEIRAERFHYRSLASMLHDAGYDVYLVNWRGHGAPDMPSKPPPSQDDWCVDHFIVYDLPAVADYVFEQTGQKPFVIAASMGAMSLAGYVQGGRIEGEGEAQRVVAETALARERQANLAGCVFVEFPAALRWPASAYDREGRLDWKKLVKGWREQRSQTNYPFEFAARLGWLQAVVTATGEVPLRRFRGDRDREPWYCRLPEPWAQKVARLERNAMQTLLNMAGTFTGATNHRAEVLMRGRRYVVDDMKAGVLRQLAKSVRQGAFVSDIGSPDHVYSEHYDQVTLPVLVIQGGRDRIANASVTREAFFDRIASADKTWLYDERIAHGEIEAAPAATTRLYPKIIEWLDARKAAQRRP